MNRRLKNCIQILQYAIQHSISASASCTKNAKGKNYVSNFIDLIEKRKNSGFITEQEYNNFQSIYKQYLVKVQTSNYNFKSPVLQNMIDGLVNSQPLTPERNLNIEPYSQQELEDIKYNAELDDSYDLRSVGESVKDESGKIKEYHYKILIRDEQPLEGTFSREEMDRIYRNYSSIEGASLNTRAVAREFPHLSTRDFKRILRAFNITKSSVPFAPHIVLENSEDVVVEYAYRNKENNIIKKLEVDKNKFVEKSLIEARKTIIELKSEGDYIQSIVEKYIEKKDLGDQTLPVIKTNTDDKNDSIVQSTPTICIFGDPHFGKKFDRQVRGRGYNKIIAHERMIEIANRVIKDFKQRNPSEIIMISLGDLVECIMEDGMHPAHTYEMDLFREEQIFYAVDSITEMILTVKKNVSCPIIFHSIHGNHDRNGKSRDDDKNRTAGKIISHILKRNLECDTIRFNIPENNLIKFTTGKLAIFAHHGDSALSKKRPSDIVNLHGAPGCYTVLLQGHWHCYQAFEGTNYSSLKIPSVASSDKYIQEELGNENMPGFIIGHEPEQAYGFNFEKITLY